MPSQGAWDQSLLMIHRPSFRLKLFKPIELNCLPLLLLRSSNGPNNQHLELALGMDGQTKKDFSTKRPYALQRAKGKPNNTPHCRLGGQFRQLELLGIRNQTSDKILHQNDCCKLVVWNHMSI